MKYLLRLFVVLLGGTLHLQCVLSFMSQSPHVKKIQMQISKATVGNSKNLMRRTMMSEAGDYSEEAPSDTGTVEAIPSPSSSTTTTTSSSSSVDDRSELMNKLVGMVQNTNRGRDKSNEDEIKSLIETIESMPSSETVEEKLNLLRGKWDLLWTNDDVTRASPFFWAFRKATRDIKDPVGVVGPELISESIFQITDSIPFKSIGSCSQTFTSDGRLVSEVDVEIGLQSILSVGSSKMTTTSKYSFESDDASVLELQVEKTQVLQSTLEKLVPFQLPLLGDNSAFPSGQALELVKPGSSTVYMRITYVDENYRLCSNDEDDKLFIFERSMW